MRKFIISLSFGNYLKADGGVDKAIFEYQQQFNQIGIAYIHISPVLPDKLKTLFEKNRVYTVLNNGVYCGLFDERDVWGFINEYSEKGNKCVGIHIHHTKKFDVRFVKKIVSAFNVPVYFFLHDYYSICEQPNLLYNGENFCGNEKKPGVYCQKCKYGNGIRYHQGNIIQILEESKKLIIVSPSELTMDIWKKTYGEKVPNAEYLIVPHQEPIGLYEKFPDLNSKIKIAFIGRYGDNKGKKQWQELVDFIEKEKLEYELYYLGFSDIPVNSVKKICVKVDPDNPDKMLDVMRDSGINCAFMWSLWPETYSYAFFEARAANLFIITFKDSGNIAYLTNKLGNGIVYDSLSALTKDVQSNSLRNSIETFYNDEGKRGPLRYRSNSQIKELYGKSHYEYKACISGKKINYFVKKTIEKFYLKKNKVGISND